MNTHKAVKKARKTRDEKAINAAKWAAKKDDKKKDKDE